MAGKELLYDLSTIDFDKPVATIEDIRKAIPQRFEMEHLSAVVYADPVDRKLCVGYKQVTEDEFWVRGHMPGMPIMPGVIMLEAMAQLASFFVVTNDLLKSPVVGFGGVEDCRFRGPVRPGERLDLICELIKVRPRRMIVCRFQGVVGDRVTVDGVLKGIPLPLDALPNE